MVVATRGARRRWLVLQTVLLGNLTWVSILTTPTQSVNEGRGRATPASIVHLIKVVVVAT